MDDRLKALAQWSAQQLKLPHCPLHAVSGDASFRRYFRTNTLSPALIAMDAPPEKEDSGSFISIANEWRTQGIRVPRIIHHDLNLGFILLEDFGDQVLLQHLNPAAPDIHQAENYYPKAIEALLAIQQTSATQPTLPLYDATLLDREMALFKDWLLDEKLGLSLSTTEHQLIDSFFSSLRNNALEQPQVPVHRDYHSRNLMVDNKEPLGILDFQDAVLGPISYDLVSLLRDCYIVWPSDKVVHWVELYFQRATEAQLINVELTQFTRWFDLMGMQRHLKAAGIFARLSIRDGKHAYLNDIPTTLDYLIHVSTNYREFDELNQWLVQRVHPAVSAMAAAT